MEKISVFVVTYNRASYLRRCIESILQQSYSNFKLIILDNASTDNTNEVLKEFNDNRIEYIRHEQNLGGRGNINYALNFSKYVHGEYVVVFHDDDEMREDFLKSEVEYMESHGSCDMVSCLNEIIDENDNIISRYFKGDKEVLEFSSGRLLREYWYNQYNLIFPTIMYRRNFLEKFGVQLNEQVGPCADVILYLDAEKNGANISVIQKQLMKSRVHSNQASSVKFGTMLIELIAYMKKDSYYSQYMNLHTQAQEVYFNWFVKKVIIRCASRSITSKMGKNEIDQMATLLKHKLLIEKIAKLVLQLEGMAPFTVNKAYKILKKRKQNEYSNSNNL